MTVPLVDWRSLGHEQLDRISPALSQPVKPPVGMPISGRLSNDWWLRFGRRQDLGVLARSRSLLRAHQVAGCAPQLNGVVQAAYHERDPHDPSFSFVAWNGETGVSVWSFFAAHIAPKPLVGATLWPHGSMRCRRPSSAAVKVAAKPEMDRRGVCGGPDSSKPIGEVGYAPGFD